jgi:hypothetical protein
MARGIDVVEGWPAVAWVAGMGAGLLLTAGLLWLRSRSFRDEPAVLPGYRTKGADGSSKGAEMRAGAVLMVVLCVLSQLLYIGLYIELAQWLLGAREQPSIVIGLFFWVILITGTCAGASLYTAWKESP